METDCVYDEEKRGEASKVEMLRSLVEQRLRAAADDIFILFQRTIAEYEEELSRTKRENDKRRRLLSDVWSQRFLSNDADVHQSLRVHEQQDQIPGVDQEQPEPPRRPEEQWTNEEPEQLHLQRLRALVKHRIDSDGDEIFVLFERTISEYKQELSRTKEENERNRKLLDAVLNPTVLLHRTVCPADVHQLSVVKEEAPPDQEDPEPFYIKQEQEDLEPPHIKEEQEDPEPPHFKEEQEELWTNQEASFIRVLVKSENDDVQSSELHPTQTESPTEDSEDTEESDDWTDAREPESDFKEKTNPAGSRSVEQMKPEPDKNRVHVKDYKRRAVQSGPSWSKRRTSDKQSPVEFGQRPDGWLCQKTNMAPLADTTRDTKDSNDLSGCDEQQDRTGQWSESGKTFQRVSSAGQKTNVTQSPKTSRDTMDKNECDGGHSRKRYQCLQCDKAFSQKANLDSHMRIHTGEKPFPCSECDKAFRVKSHLRTHMRIHTGEKPFVCSECDKRFNQKVNLRHHMTIHTREKHFSCSLCQISFQLKDALLEHMLTQHTGGKPV